MAYSNGPSGTTYYMPAETGLHAGTIMAWPTRSSILGEAYLYPCCDVEETRQEVAEIAKAVAKFEPLRMFVQHLKYGDSAAAVEHADLESAKQLLGDTANITIHPTSNVHSLWARDSGPVFVLSKNGAVNNTYGVSDEPGIGLLKKNTSTHVVGLCLSFNNWGKKNLPNPDFFFAHTASQTLDMSTVLAPFIAEGGAIEVDGEGTMLATESSILNPNRNPGIDKPAMERYLLDTLGVEKVLWIPGVRGADITDDHIDLIARFPSPGTVLLSRPFAPEASEEDDVLAEYHSAKQILTSSTDARGRPLTIIDVPEPDPRKVIGKDFDPAFEPAISYLNFLVVNGGLVMARFGDEEMDRQAARIIGEQYPGRQVEQVYLHQLALQGGGVHCATQHIIA